MVSTSHSRTLPSRLPTRRTLPPRPSSPLRKPRRHASSPLSTPLSSASPSPCLSPTPVPCPSPSRSPPAAPAPSRSRASTATSSSLVARRLFGAGGGGDDVAKLLSAARAAGRAAFLDRYGFDICEGKPAGMSRDNHAGCAGNAAWVWERVEEKDALV